MAAVSAATDAAPPVLVHHVVDVYFELCTRYKVQPSPPVTIALRFPDVTYLQLDASFGPADLLPLAELLRVSQRLRHSVGLAPAWRCRATARRALRH